MNSKVSRIIMPLAVLSLFYWNIYVRPGPGLMGTASSAVDLSPEQSREILDLSRTRLQEGNYEEALTLTERLHEAYPTNHVYVNQLAIIYNHLERYKEEAESWEKYMKFSPTPIDACPQLGEAYRKHGMVKEMVDACERCMRLESNSDTIFFLARAYEITGQLDRAKELYQRGIERAPLYNDQRIGLARIHLRQGRVRAAKEIISKIVNQYPNNVDALLVYGMALRLERNYARAKELLEQGARLSPNYTDFYVVLGGIAEQEGNIEQAINHYNKALELSPENTDLAARRNRLIGGGL